MKNKKLFSLFLLLSLIIGVAAVMAALRTQDNLPSERQKAVGKKIHDEDYPIADYAMQEHLDLQEDKNRKERRKRYNLPGNINQEDRKRFVLKESSPLILLQEEASDAQPEPAIPVTQSDAIVIGEITSAKAYLTDDKTGVYSEFVVHIVETLKNNLAEQLIPDTHIHVERLGGRVRFPSGKILLRGGPYGRNMPSMGQRYVLFLKYNKDGQDYTIITGYNLRDGRVFPLDGSPEGNGKSPRFTEYEKYQGIGEDIFLNDLRTAIKGKG